jgi:thiamine transport system permease protein
LKKTGIILWPILFWSAAFALPLISVAYRAAGSFSELSGLFHSTYYRGLLGFTMKQAALSTLFSVLLGLPGAYFIGRYDFPGKKILKSISTVPFVLPSILAVLGFILVFGHSGFINAIRAALSREETSSWRILYSLKAIILAHVFYNFPLTLRIVGDAWSSLPQSEYSAARSLGAGPLKAFLTVDLPRLIPGVLTSGVITFLYCFLSFAIILVLGGGPEFTTLEVEVYRLIKFQLDFSRGSGIAIFESIIAIGLLAIYSRIDNRLRERTTVLETSVKRRSTGRIGKWKSIPGILYLIPALFLIMAPLLSIISYSFLSRASRTASLMFSLHHWKNLFGGGRVEASVPMLSILRTFILGGAVAILTTLTASLAGWYSVRNRGTSVRILETMMFLPMGISSVILGLGYLILTDSIPGSNTIRLISLAAAHSIMALPFAYRIISGRLKELSPRIPQAAQAAGAGPVKSFFTIELPQARGALITASVFSLALSAGELNATIILAPGNFTTMPLAIYRMIGAYDISGACTLGTILIAISILSFLTLDNFGDNRL